MKAIISTNELVKLISTTDILRILQLRNPDIKEVELTGTLSEPTFDPTPRFDPALLPLRIGRYLAEGNLIAGIKEARAMYGLGLKEAKDYCEQYYPRRTY